MNSSHRLSGTAANGFDRDLPVTGKSVLIAGAGNIGSPLVSVVARMPEVGRIILADPDRYSADNCRTQDIRASDVGKFKVAAAAREIRAIRPAELVVDTYPMIVEAVPLGVLRHADLIVGCVDSRSGRLAINELSWRVNRPWIDTSVSGPDLLSRVSVYMPSANRVCYECRFTDAADYAALDTVYSCFAPTESPATNAPSELGMLTASIAAFQVRLMLQGKYEQALVGRQLLLDARSHQQILGRLTPNPDCKFDHKIWDIQTLAQSPDEISIADTLALAPRGTANSALRMDGQAFVNRVTCIGCGEPSRRAWRLSARLSPRQKICPGCGDSRYATGMDTENEMTGALISEAWRKKKLSSLGFRPGDVFSVVSAGVPVHFELGGHDDRSRI